MAHARKQLREAVETALTGLTITGSNVTASRVYPHTDLPSLAIYSPAEELVGRDMSGKQERALTVAVEIRAQATSDLDDTLDAISVEVEEAVATSAALRSLVMDSYLSSMESELSDEAEQPVGLMRLLFLLTYVVAESDVETLA
jgi:hypothetical protein